MSKTRHTVAVRTRFINTADNKVWYIQVITHAASISAVHALGATDVTTTEDGTIAHFELGHCSYAEADHRANELAEAIKNA